MNDHFEEPGHALGVKASASKKSLFAIEQARHDFAWRRKRWKSIQPRNDPNPIA